MSAGEIPLAAFGCVVPHGTRREKIAQLEAWIVDKGPVKIPVVHRFTPGLYVRECQIPAGAILTSMEHLTEHPFFLMRGSIVVTSDNEGEVRYDAPFIGVTLPHTKRALYALSDVVWVTVHATDCKDPDEIGRSILDQTPNPLLDDANPERLEGWKKESTYQGPGNPSSRCLGSQSEP